MELTKEYNSIEPGLKGWLILPMVTLIVQVIAFFKSFSDFMNNPGAFRIPLNGWIFAYNIILVVLTLHVAYFFFKKKAITPVYFIVYRIILYIPWVFIYLAGSNLPLTSSAQNSLIQPFVAHTIGILVLVPYFVFSRRVKATFQLPLEPSKTLEAIMVKVQPFFARVEGFLDKTRKWLILEVLGLIIFTLFFGILITSL